MAAIHLLDENIAQKIAAGEVVERPASVVKELVENSIDAGSSFVTVEIREGGIEFLRVTDNGCGIPAGEVELAFLRHATSKIQTLDDLYNIRQMGFRGEALYSIAAVSKLELVTKPAEQRSGVRLVIHGGKKVSSGDYGCPDGTTIVVSDLFYNTPARLKFLNRPSVEAGYIGTVITRLILANPGVSIKFVNNGKVLYHSTGDGNLMNAVYIVFGKDVASRLLPVEQTVGKLGIGGFLFAPQDARGNRSSQFLMVNGRPVMNQQISSTVERLYGGLCDYKRFPGFVLNISLPPSELDVNVHPNKLQVRFAQEHQVRQMVEIAVSKALERYQSQAVPWAYPAQPTGEPPEGQEDGANAREDGLVRETSVKESYPPQETPRTSVGESVSNLTENIRRVLDGGFLGSAASVPQSLAQRPTIRAVEGTGAAEQPSFVPSKPSARIIGQVFSTYVLVEHEDKLLIIDQHAAHERLLYDRYTQALAESRGCAQPLLIAQTLEVSFEAKTVIDSNLPLLRELGFEIEEYGRLGYQVRSVPFILGQPQVAGLMIQIIDALSDDRSLRLDDLKREKLMSMACKKAVKAGDALSQSELDALIGLIAEEQTPLTCPHGRPFVLVMDRHSMDRQFKRVK